MLTGRDILIVSRPKFGALRHVGVLLPNGYVAHCAPGRGEHVSTVEEFASGHDMTIDRAVPHMEHTGTLQRIAEAMRSPKPYNVTKNNCEMFANRVTTGKAESPQLQGTIVLLGLAMFMGWAAAKK